MSDTKTEAMQKLDLILAKLTTVEQLLKAQNGSAAHAAAGGGGICFPGYGRSKGLPVKGASAGDLGFYRNGSLRTLGDPSKARFHEKERVLLQAIEAEMRAQGIAFDAEELPAEPDDSLPY